MVSTKSSSTVSRSIRKVTAYSTRDGSRPIKQRPVEYFAPSLQLHKKAATSDDATPAEGTAFHSAAAAAVADLIRAAKASAVPSVLPPTKVSTAQQRVFQACVTAPDSSLLVKRIVVEAGESSAFDSVGLGALQRAAVMQERQQRAEDGQSLLVIVDDDSTADRLATRLRVVFRVASFVLDGTRFPSIPSSPSSTDLVASTLVLIATPASLVAVDRRSAIWKFCGVLVLCGLALRGASVGAAALQEARLNVPARSCIVIGYTATDMYQKALEPLVLPAEAATPSVSRRSPTQVSYMVLEGSQKFMALYQLVVSQSAAATGRPLVVHFACAETCAFMCDALYALQTLPDHVRLVCDSEILPRNQTDKTLAATCRLAHDVEKQFMATVSTRRSGAVLLSALRIVPPVDGAILTQFDPLLDVMNFSSFVADRVTPGAALPATPPAVSATPQPQSGKKRARSNSPPPAPRAVMPATPSRAVLVEGADVTPAPAKKQEETLFSYHSVLLFLHPNEVQAARPILEASGARLSIKYVLSPPPAAGNSSLLAAQKLRSLVKKMFVLNNKAFEAYRGLMQVYSRLQPKSVFNVKEINLQAAAECFGLDEAPLLDLRTKTTVFRPKEDLYKASQQRLKHDRKEKKAFADAQLIGEEPEDHMA